MRLLVLIFAFVFFFIPQSFSKTLIWKTEKELGESKQLRMDCDPDKDDECHNVLYASSSKYGRILFITYQESARAYISFDESPVKNWQKQYLFDIRQLAPGAIDWGGVMEGGNFNPLYAVKRFYDPGFDYSTDNVNQSKSGLYVWRLSPATGKGNSDMIGMAGAQVEKARALAEKDFSSRH